MFPWQNINNLKHNNSSKHLDMHLTGLKYYSDIIIWIIQVDLIIGSIKIKKKMNLKNICGKYCFYYYLSNMNVLLVSVKTVYR